MPEDLSNSYKIRPNFKQKFRPVAVKAIIHDVLNEELSGKQYNSEEATSWSKHISDTVKEKLKDLDLERYKFIVQVVIGEQRGEGVKVACRCLWDSDTDNYAQDIFMNVGFLTVAYRAAAVVAVILKERPSVFGGSNRTTSHEYASGEHALHVLATENSRCFRFLWKTNESACAPGGYSCEWM